MSVLSDEALERLAMLLSRGSLNDAEEIARLVRMELCTDIQKTPILDVLFRFLWS